MATTGKHFCGLLVAALVIGAAPVQASETSITIQATVMAVQCTPQQRLRIRACAPVVEKLTVEQARTMAHADVVVASNSQRIMSAASATRDPTHKVLVRTLYY
jgi:hypothetical protein